MKTKLPKFAGTAALSVMIGLVAGCADSGSSAKTNTVKVAQYSEGVMPVVREPLPGITPPVQSPGRARDLESAPVNDTPLRVADAGNNYVTPVGGSSRYGDATDAFSNGFGSARGTVGRAGRGGSGGSGVAGATRVALAGGGPRGSVAGAAKAGQAGAGQNLSISGTGEQLIAAVDNESTGGRSDFNSLVPRTGTSGSASDAPSPVTSGVALPAAPVAPKPPVVSAPPPIVASTDSISGAAAPAPAVTPAPPAPVVSAGITPPPAAPSPAAPSATAPPVVANLAPPAPGASTPTAPVAGRPGSGTESPSITVQPLSPDALLPKDMEMPFIADNTGVEGDPMEGPDVTQIPSPATALLMLVGFAGMAWVRRRAR